MVSYILLAVQYAAPVSLSEVFYPIDVVRNFVSRFTSAIAGQHARSPIWKVELWTNSLRFSLYVPYTRSPVDVATVARHHLMTHRDAKFARISERRYSTLACTMRTRCRVSRAPATTVRKDKTLRQSVSIAKLFNSRKASNPFRTTLRISVT